MQQGVFLFLLFLMGLTFLGLFRNSLDIVTIGLLSFPIGSSLWVFFSLTIIISGIPFTPSVMFSTNFLWLFITGLIIYFKKEFRKSDLIALAIITTSFILTLLLALSFKYVIASNDSWGFISMGKIISRFAGYHDSFINHWWTNYGVFIGLVYTGASFLEFGYAYAFIPVLSFWFILGFSWLLYKALRCSVPKSWAGLLAIFTILTFINTYIIILQSYIIQSNMTAAVYFSLAIACLWYYLTEKKEAWLVLSMISLTSFSFCRIEGPVFALFVLFNLVAQEEISYKQAISCTAFFVTITFAWHLKLLSVFGFKVWLGFLTSQKLLFFLMILGGVFLFMIFSKYPLVAKIKNNSPIVMLYVLGLLTVYFAFSIPKLAKHNFNALFQNMFVQGYWGATWILIFLLTGIGFCLKPLKKEFMFISIITGYLMLLYVSGFFMHFWNIGLASPNRVLSQVFPTIMFYLFLKYGYNLPVKHRGPAIQPE